jgi:hypothetical protein
MEYKNLDKFVAEKFSASYMSNAKWLKLIEALTHELDQIHFRYKLIYSDVIKRLTLDMAEDAPFIIEPIHYKEVEWIEFPTEYEDYKNPNNLKAGKRIYNQDLKTIEAILTKVGTFKLELSPEHIKLFAYS